MKVFWKFNMWIHRITGTIILLMTLVMGFLGIKHMDWTITNDLHSVMGFIVLLLIFFITVGGVFTRSMMNRIKWNTALILKIKTGHRVRFDNLIYLVIWCDFDNLCSADCSGWRSLAKGVVFYWNSPTNCYLFRCVSADPHSG